jgi:thiol reductant ABC exporter CydC subunit
MNAPLSSRRHHHATPGVTVGRSCRAFSLRRLTPTIVSGLLSVACGIGLLGTSGWLITRAAERPPVFVLSIAIGSVQAFALGRGVCRYVQRLAVHDLSLELLGGLRLDLFDSLEQLLPGGLGTNGSGEVINGFMAETELVAQGFSKAMTAAVDVGASILLGTLVLCLIEPLGGAILLAGSLIVLFSCSLCTRLGRAGARRESLARSELAGTVIETLRAAPELVAYGREDLLEDRLRSVQRRSAAAGVQSALGVGMGRAAATWTGGATLVALLAVSLPTLGTHRVSGVLLAVMVFVTLAVFDQLASLPVVLGDLDAGDQADFHLRSLSALDPPAPEPSRSDEHHGEKVSAAPSATLEHVDVVLGETEILQDVSLTVPDGQRVALVGPSGSGKSTVIHTLLHFREATAGIASIGGVDVRKLTRSRIARNLGWMAETHLFATTLRDNLCLGKPDASDETCLRALELVGLDDWFAGLPDGLDTLLGANGRPVSAGERQRLGMARTLLAGSSILLLDEPTAHLDPASSGPVLTALLGAVGERGVLLVSHEPGIEAYVDEVVTLEEGRLAPRQVCDQAAKKKVIAPDR